MNKIISIENGVKLEWNNGKQVFTVPSNSVYTTFNKDTVNFVLTSLPHNIGISLMSSLMSELEVDGVIYTSESELEKALNSALNAPQGLEFKIVDELPSEGKKGVIYLIPLGDEGDNKFEEWIYVDGKWELLGNARVDLSNYYTKDEVDEGNEIVAASFNILKDSIGLNDNLEPIDYKLPIQTQIDIIEEKVNKLDPLATDLSNIDAKGVEVIKEITSEEFGNYYTKDEVDEGNKVYSKAFNVLKDTIGLTKYLKPIDGKAPIQTQIDEVKETIPTQFKTINDESILGEGNIELDLSNYYTKSEIDAKIGEINTLLENLIG